MLEVLAYLNWPHQSLFPCCLLLQQLLSGCLAHPRAPMADGRTGTLRLERHKEKLQQLVGFSDCMWCWPNYLNCPEYFIFRNKCGMSVHTACPHARVFSHPNIFLPHSDFRNRSNFNWISVFVWVFWRGQRRPVYNRSCTVSQLRPFYV